MASNAFRDSMNSLGWSRREPEPVSTSNSSTPFLQTLSSYNPFNRSGYIGLPTHNDEAPGAPLPAPTRREEEEGFFALSRWDRLLIFGACILASVVCFAICFFFLFVLALNPTKFATLWSVGSIFFLISWAVLLGPKTYITHLLSGPRLPFTMVYLGSIALTLYFSISLQSSILAGLSGLVQLSALAWYLVSYFPMGSTGMRFAAKFGTNRAMAWMSG